MSFLKEHQYTVAGALAGLILVLLLITFGLFKTLLLFAFVAVGGFIGSQLKDTGLLESLAAKFNKKN